VVAISVFAFSRNSPSEPTPAINNPPTAAIGPAPTTSALVPAQELQGPYPVTRVVDGDTIHVQTPSGDVTVRLIGIDTPETVAPGRPVECFGPESSAEVRRLLDGRSVYLEPDSSQDAVDKYGRTLAYVWLTPTDSVNFELVADGFATEYLYRTPYHHHDAFVAAQASAQAAGRGLWSACG
jgi:micrococcal nuclease